MMHNLIFRYRFFRKGVFCMKNFIHSDLSSAAFQAFLDGLCAVGTQFHSMLIYENNVLKLSWSLEPYRCEDVREQYSLSKLFTSTAIGAAYDRGLLDVEDKVVSFFPEYQELWSGDPRWQRMTVHHLLTMNSGHENCVMPAMAFSQDSVRSFFESPLQYEPGSFFCYNTGATCLLAEIVKRATGMAAPQWLEHTLFASMDIREYAWKTCSDGRCQGGTGLCLSSVDVAKLGLLYANDGLWNGEQLLSPRWIEMASSSRVSNHDNGTPDWSCGYGYQFWQNSRGGFRGDGAFGQICAVLPEKQLVCVLMAECDEMDDEIQLLWTFLDHMHDPSKAVEPTQAYQPSELPDGPDWDSGWRNVQENPCGIRALKLQRQGSSLLLEINDGAGIQKVTAHSGVWTQNTLQLPNFCPTLYTMMPRIHHQLLRFVACPKAQNDAWVLEARSLNSPHAFEMHFSVQQDGKLCMRLTSRRDVFGSERDIREI